MSQLGGTACSKCSPLVFDTVLKIGTSGARQRQRWIICDCLQPWRRALGVQQNGASSSEIEMMMTTMIAAIDWHWDRVSIARGIWQVSKTHLPIFAFTSNPRAVATAVRRALILHPRGTHLKENRKNKTNEWVKSSTKLRVGSMKINITTEWSSCGDEGEGL